jgi:hypothetical protein
MVSHGLEKLAANGETFLQPGSASGQGEMIWQWRTTITATGISTLRAASIEGNPFGKNRILPITFWPDETQHAIQHDETMGQENN